MDISCSIFASVLLILLLHCSSLSVGKVTRCFEDTDCVPNDVCINYSCYEIRTFEERCSFDKECSHLNRRLMCINSHCACQPNLKWVWSISRCGPLNYCQIEQDCPGSDFKCNHTLTRCYKINPIKSRTKKLPRPSSRYSLRGNSSPTVRPAPLYTMLPILLLPLLIFRL